MTVAIGLASQPEADSVLTDDSFEAAIMAGDDAAADWLRGYRNTAPVPVEPDPGALDDDDGRGCISALDEGWLPALTVEDHALVREYMLSNRFPPVAAHSIESWPISEIRHLLLAARGWKAAEAQRATERAEMGPAA